MSPKKIFFDSPNKNNENNNYQQEIITREKQNGKIYLQSLMHQVYIIL